MPAGATPPPRAYFRPVLALALVPHSSTESNPLKINSMPIARDAIHTTQSSVHLDAIRGAAALTVLLGHTRGLFFSSFAGGQRYSIHSSTGQVPVPRPITSPDLNITIGNEGVIIFFVLSGYLVGGSAIKALRQNTWSWNDYLVKRLTRLWVVLLPALVLGVVLDYTGLHLFSHPDSIYSAPPEQQLVYKDLLTRLSVPVIVGNALFLQTIVVAPAGTNDSLWSLANEFWYYLAFPLLLLVLRPDEKRWLRGLYLLSAAGIILLVGRSISQLFPIWILGALISVMPQNIPRRAAKISSAVLACLLPIVFVAVKRCLLPKYGAEWIVALFFAIFLYMVLHQIEKARTGIYQTMSGFFARISYTLYLFHLPLAVFMCAWLNTPWHYWQRSPPNVAIFAMLNVVVVLVSYLVYLMFEANTDRVRHSLFSAAPSGVPAS
jgi:peptidoglycan/LPS O-acetylase OafA/YrhL